MKRQCLKLLILCGLAAALLNPIQANADAMKPTPMTIVVYEAGANWKDGKAPNEQDLGPHFGYVADKLKDGTLVANGLQTDAIRGYYVVGSGDPAVVKDYLDNDPALKGGVLKVAEQIGWGVLIKAFAPAKPGEAYFILRYTPGKSWEAGKSLMDQAIGPHFSYITEKAKAGMIVGGGPNLSADGGIYIVKLADKSAAKAFVAHDPGVKSGVFAPSIIGWNVLNMQAAK